MPAANGSVTLNNHVIARIAAGALLLASVASASAAQMRLDRHRVVNDQFAANMALNAKLLS